MNNILLVIDMQNDFIFGSLKIKNPSILIRNIENKIKNFKGQVIFTKDTHQKNYLQTLEGNKIPVPHCIINSEGHEIIDNLKKYSNQKNTILKSSFTSKKIGELFLKLNKVKKISSITIIGVCTDICVISNALLLRGYLPNTPIYVDSKCCAGTSLKNHKNALNIMAANAIDII